MYDNRSSLICGTVVHVMSIYMQIFIKPQITCVLVYSNLLESGLALENIERVHKV